MLNMDAYMQLHHKMNDVENKVFAETRKALARWRESGSYLQDMIDFQLTTTSHVQRALK